MATSPENHNTAGWPGLPETERTFVGTPLDHAIERIGETNIPVVASVMAAAVLGASLSPAVAAAETPVPQRVIHHTTKDKIVRLEVPVGATLNGLGKRLARTSHMSVSAAEHQLWRDNHGQDPLMHSWQIYGPATLVSDSTGGYDIVTFTPGDTIWHEAEVEVNQNGGNVLQETLDIEGLNGVTSEAEAERIQIGARFKIPQVRSATTVTVPPSAPEEPSRPAPHAVPHSAPHHMTQTPSTGGTIAPPVIQEVPPSTGGTIAPPEVKAAPSPVPAPVEKSRPKHHSETPAPKPPAVQTPAPAEQPAAPSPAPIPVPVPAPAPAPRHSKVNERHRTARSSERRPRHQVKVNRTRETAPTDYTLNSSVIGRSGLSSRQLRYALEQMNGGTMAGLAEDIHIAEVRYNINGLYIAAAAAIESRWGTSYFARERNNFFGIQAYTDNPDLATSYSNPTANIRAFVELLANAYLFPGGEWYAGPSLHGIYTHYSTAHDSEAISIASLMNELRQTALAMPSTKHHHQPHTGQKPRRHTPHNTSQKPHADSKPAEKQHVQAKKPATAHQVHKPKPKVHRHNKHVGHKARKRQPVYKVPQRSPGSINPHSVNPGQLPLG